VADPVTAEPDPAPNAGSSLAQGPAPARAGRRRRFRLVAALVTMGVALLVGELALRLRHLTRARRPDKDAWHEFDATFGWRAKTSWTGLGHAGNPPVTFSVRTNARGLRLDREVAERPAPGVRRIAFCGDSFVFGYGCEVEDTCVAHVDSALAAAAAAGQGPPAEVLNLGTCAYGVDQIRLAVERTALPLSPSLILFGVIEDDFRRSLRAVSITGHAKPRFLLAGDDQVRLTGVPVAAPPPPGTLYYDDSPPDGGSFLRWELGLLLDRGRIAVHGGDEASQPRWHLGRALLLDAHRLAAARGVPLAVVLFPVPRNLERGEPYRALLASLEPTIPVCDLYPLFEAVPPADRPALFLPGDGHLTPRGQALAAEGVVCFLRERHLLGAR
jgi:hypothetical protein